MNYTYLPSVLAGTQVPYQPTLVPQGASVNQLGQATALALGQYLPGPFGAIPSQLLPQLVNSLPFQAGPQAGFGPQGLLGTPFAHLAGGIAGQLGPYGGIGNQWVPQTATLLPFHTVPQQGFMLQPVIGNPWGHLPGGMAAQLGQYGGIGGQWGLQAGPIMPYQAGPQPVFYPQGVIGGQPGQLAGNVLGQYLPGPFGAIASQLQPQIGSVLLPFQAGAQPVPMAGYGLNQPFIHFGVQW